LNVYRPEVGLSESSDLFVFGHEVIDDEPACFFFFFFVVVANASCSACFEGLYPCI
jgi:hypothetical protein